MATFLIFTQAAVTYTPNTSPKLVTGAAVTISNTTSSSGSYSFFSKPDGCALADAIGSGATVNVTPDVAGMYIVDLKQGSTVVARLAFVVPEASGRVVPVWGSTGDDPDRGTYGNYRPTLIPTKGYGLDIEKLLRNADVTSGISWAFLTSRGDMPFRGAASITRLAYPTVGSFLYHDGGAGKDLQWIPMTMLPQAVALSGLYSALPAAGASGRTYTTTDGPIRFFDDGAAWRPMIGGTLGKLTPVASGFTAFGPGDATIADSFGGLLFTAPTSGGGTMNKNRLWYKAKAAAQTVIVHFRMIGTATAGLNFSFGIGFRNAGNGKFTTIQCTPSVWNQVHWSDATTAAAITSGDLIVGEDVWFKLVDDGTTNITAYVSPNGRHWLQVFQEARASFVTSGADQWCYFVQPYTGTGIIYVDSTEVL